MDDAGVARRDVGVWCGLVLVLAGAFVRAVCRAEPFPWWEADPYRFAPPLVGLTPVWALGVNAVVILGSVVVLASARGGLGTVGSWLFAVGLGVIGWHAAADIETVGPGADLAAGVCAMAAVWVACATPGVKRVVVGVALGFGVMLAAVGLQQVYVEHPRTVESFESSRDAFYAARGWVPGGPEALMYEERLSHANPTGAFGLTNVLATFAGASFVGLLACVFGRGWTRWARVAIGLGALASGWALLATGSKGGIGSALLAGALVLVVSRVRAAWIGRAVVLAAVGVVAAVAVRGVIGDGLGEKSLLFRAQYQVGAAVVLAEHPLVGVGAGNFQDAYTRLKPAGAVEDVTSTHSVWVDWLAGLGLGGAALVGLSALGWWAKAGDDESDSEGLAARGRVRAACGVVACAIVAAVLTSRAAMGLEQAAAVVGGGVGWMLVAGWIAGGTREVDGAVRAAAIAGGAVALVHGQLDVTGMWAVSAPSWGVLVGCGIGCLRGGSRVSAGRFRFVPVLAMAVLLGLIGWRGATIARWESALHTSAAWAARVSQARTELSVAGGQGEMELIADRVGGWLQSRVATDRDAISAGLDAVAMATQEEASGGLREALRARPTHVGTRVALGRVLVTISARDEVRDPGAALRAMDEAVAVAEEGTRVSAGDGGAWVWSGRVLERRGSLGERMGDPGADWLERAAEAWVRADGLMPQDPGSAARLAELFERMGLAEEAAAWAGRAIERDGRMGLDPRRGLGSGRRVAMERLAGG